MLFSFEGTNLSRSGGYREVVTPGPISNPEVKHFIGEPIHLNRWRIKHAAS